MKRAEDAVRAINKNGALLVFPINNKKEPSSLWYKFYPRTRMRWEWDEHGDNRLSGLWLLRSTLSLSREVVYTKWYRGRATFLSRRLFVAMLAGLQAVAEVKTTLSRNALEILEILEIDSPMSTKALKTACGLRGRSNEAAYESALKELWSRLQIVAFGEVDEGAFPSLAIGATSRIFEDLVVKAKQLQSSGKVEAALLAELSADSPFFKDYQKIRAGLIAPARQRKIPSVIMGKNFFRGR